MEYYVGIDLHKHYFVYHATDKEGVEFSKGRLDNELSQVDELLRLFPSNPQVVIEAGTNWMWLTKALKGRGCNVTLAHPTKVKAIASARIKTDKIDAKILCHLLRTNLIPQAYIATADEQDLREISRARISLVHDRTLLKNRIHAILTKENLIYKGSDMFGVKGREWLDTQKLSLDQRCVVSIYLTQLDNLKEAIEAIEELIKQKCGSLPEVKLLLSIPSIGITTAFTLATEIGDVKRFKSSKSFASYLGLIPRIHQSGSHAYYGRITKLGNPYVRWSLVQAAHRLYRMNVNYRDWVDKLSYRVGKKKAIVALSRKISAIVYVLLKENRQYIADYQRRPKVYPDIIPGNQATA